MNWKELGWKNNGKGPKTWVLERIELLRKRYPEQGSDIPELLKYFTHRGITMKAYRSQIKYIGKRKKSTQQENTY